jgi:hypothetical protein
MAYELNVREERTPCWRCEGEAVVSTCERVDDVVGVPLWRSVRRTARCGSCRAWRKSPVSRAEQAAHPRTIGVWRHIIISYIILAGLAAGGIVWAVNHREMVRGFAEAPRVDDRWTVKTDPWPDRIDEDSEVYAFARVDAVTDSQVALIACSQTGASKDADDCTTFGVTMQPVRRADVRRLLDDDVIDTIERPGLWVRKAQLAGLFGLALALFALHGWRSRQYFRD